MKVKASICILIIVSFLSSCVPNKDLIYLQDKGAEKAAMDMQIQLNAKPYKLQIGDLLSINIKALDKELVALFKTTNDETSQQSQNSLYFNGFTVDIHGNIEIPIIGKMNVLGYTTEEISDRVEELLLKEYFEESANIFVTVKLSGLRFTVNGEVGTTGTVTLFKERVTIWKLLQMQEIFQW